MNIFSAKKALIMMMCCLLAWVPEVYAATESEASWKPLLEGLVTEDKYSGGFTQERHLSILQAPIVSKGTFSIQKDTHIQWNVTSPFAIEYFYEGDKLQQCSAFNNEKTCNNIAKRDDPMLHGFFSFFTRMFSGQNKALDDWFDVTLDGEEKQVLMTPKKSFLKKSFAAIRIKHDTKKVTQVVIEEAGENGTASGDKQVLSFNYQ